MKKIIFALLVVLSVSSCGKKRCYTCTTTDYSKSGTTPQSFEKCGTDNQIERFVKKNTSKKYDDPNLTYPTDIITECKLQ